MAQIIKLGLLSLTTIFVVFTIAACSGKSEGSEAAKSEAPEEAAPKPTPTPEKSEENAEKEANNKDNMKERAGDAYKSLHCAGSLATPKGAAETYKEHGFKSPKHFMKIWTHYAKKDSNWAHEIATAAEKMDCKK